MESEIRLPVTFRVSSDSLMSSYAEGHAFLRDYDQPPRPVGGMDALKARLEMPGEFYRDAGPGETGKVSVEVWVREDGVLQRVKLRHSDHPALVEALRGVKWVPAKKDGKPVGSIFGLPVTFRMKER